MNDKTLYVLSESPLVVAGSFGCFAEAAKISGSITLIYHNPWWVRPRNLWRYIRISRLFKGEAKVVFVTNEPSEARWLRLLGMNAIAISQNLHVRDQFFTPGDEAKLHDAVYAAQLAPFKRLHLAGEIEKLSILTYQYGSPRWDLHAFEPRLSHAKFNAEFVSKEEVRKIYRSSKVALALSAVEGAMWASCESLLTGLPMVSTVNRGGRDRYFEPWYAATVQPHPDAIARAVQRFVDAPPDPYAIRNAVMVKMHADRLKLLGLMSGSLGVRIPDLEEEVARLWGSETGIEKHAVPVSEIASAF